VSGAEDEEAALLRPAALVAWRRPGVVVVAWGPPVVTAAEAAAEAAGGAKEENGSGSMASRGRMSFTKPVKFRSSGKDGLLYSGGGLLLPYISSHRSSISCVYSSQALTLAMAFRAFSFSRAFCPSLGFFFRCGFRCHLGALRTGALCVCGRGVVCEFW
jgi:hypothetical protein